MPGRGCTIGPVRAPVGEVETGAGSQPQTRSPEGLPESLAARLPETLAERVRALAEALGFDRVGFARAGPTPHGGFLRQWLARGYAGEMGWLTRRVEEREDPRRLLPGARTVIAVSLVQGPPVPQPDTEAGIAHYAGGEDYHRVLGERLRAFEEALPAVVERPVRTRSYVDTGPVLERVWAARAGLGWQGKNTCLIDREHGSFVFLGVVLTDLQLPADLPEPDHCGSCRACIDACPTDALVEPYVLDARRCLAYTTIELRERIPEPLRAPQGSWVFGCDLCQTVCPWNRPEKRTPPPDPLGLRRRLEAREVWRAPTLRWLLGLDEETWALHTRRSALRRSRFRGLLRNALVAAGNSGDVSLAPAIRVHAEGADPLLAEHAVWALRRLGAER